MGAWFKNALFLFLPAYCVLASAMSIHQPFKWSLVQAEQSVTVQTRILAGAPNFTAHLSSLIRAREDREYRRQVQYKAFYMCPSSNPGKSFCNYPGHYYCGYWGCETIASDWQVERKDPYLQVEWGPTGCTPPKHGYDGVVQGGNYNWCWYLNLTVKNPEDSGWWIGRTWGIRFWEPGVDRGGIITIKKETIREAEAVGPNRVEAERLQVATIEPTQGVIVNPLWKMMIASFRALNRTNPNLTADCWLCYDAQPPFYEAIGLDKAYNATNSSNPVGCNWQQKPAKMTMKQVTGQGKCIGKPSEKLQKLCTEVSTPKTKWVVPQQGGWWVCSKTGITPCVSTLVSDLTKEVCIQVDIIPRILYLSGSEMFEHGTRILNQKKREPVTILTIATLLGLGAVGAGTGITAIVRQNQGFVELRAAVDEDLARLEKSITYLEKSVSSLSEVVLQNRRGLDMLFLQQEGLCIALGEECCFYADHTGVVRDSLTKVREGLEKRKKERESQQGLFESWFNYSPWLTTLISTIAGPMLLLLLALIIGPCILNRIVAFVQSRIDAVKLMVVRQQYMELKSNENFEEYDPILTAAREAVTRFEQQN